MIVNERQGEAARRWRRDAVPSRIFCDDEFNWNVSDRIVVVLELDLVDPLFDFALLLS